MNQLDFKKKQRINKHIMDSDKKTIGFNYNYMNSMHIRGIQLKSVSFHAKQFEFRLN